MLTVLKNSSRLHNKKITIYFELHFFAKTCSSLLGFSIDTIYKGGHSGNSGAIKFKLLSFEAFVNSKRSCK